MNERIFRIGAAGLFEPGNCLIDTRLQQIYFANPVIHQGDIGIARAEAKRPLNERDYLLYNPGVELAVGESEQRPWDRRCDWRTAALRSTDAGRREAVGGGWQRPLPSLIG